MKMPNFAGSEHIVLCQWVHATSGAHCFLPEFASFRGEGWTYKWPLQGSRRRQRMESFMDQMRVYFGIFFPFGLEASLF